MPKHQAKVGLVSIKQGEDGKWRVRWWDARLQKYFRRLIPATSFKDAVAMAKVYNRELAGEKGFVPSVRAKAGHGVNEAIDETIRNSSASAQTKKDYALRANQFLKWLRNDRPGVTRWADLNVKALRDYLRHCESHGLAHDSVRLRFHVVRATAIYMSETYPDLYANIARAVRVKRSLSDCAAKEKPLLSARQLLDLLEYASRSRPDLAGITALQGLAGLRLFEAINVREQDIDIDRGTITVAVTSRHTPKTAKSRRTIPVSNRVLAALRERIASSPVRDPEGFIFLSSRGKPWSPYGIMHALRRLIKDAWRETAHEELRDFVPRRLRAVFVNLVREKRADHRVVEAYIGHAAGDVLGDHYEQSGIERMRAEVVERIETAIQAAEAMGSTAESIQRRASDLH